MLFEVFNDKNKRVMCTESVACIPNRTTLISMSKTGYKFKLNGKVASAKTLIEKLKEMGSVEKN